MNSSSTQKSLFLFCILGLISCAEQKGLSKASIDKSTFVVEEHAEGYQLFLNNCGKCHKLKPIEKFTDNQWMGIVPRMAQKAKLNDVEESKILKYILWQKENS